MGTKDTNEPQNPADELSFEKYVTADELAKRHPHIFRGGKDSVTWQLRQHSTALIAAGAIAIVARQHLFHVDRTPTVLIEQGILLAALAATKPKAPVPPGGHVRGRPRIHPVLELSKAVQGMTRKAVKSGVPA